MNSVPAPITKHPIEKQAGDCYTRKLLVCFKRSGCVDVMSSKDGDSVSHGSP